MKYICTQCQNTTNQWAGQCLHCKGWNTFVETIEKKKDKRSINTSSFTDISHQVVRLDEIECQSERKYPTCSQELDRALGGGLVEGSVILIGGDPGIGKSTLLLQVVAQLSKSQNVLYVTGEESLQQVALRANRLNVDKSKLYLFSETHVETIIHLAKKQKPKVLVIDSIQTIFTDSIPAAPGGVGQVRESAQQLVRYAKSSQTILFIVGHVTKEGALAGPRVLEHMVDTVLYFEGQNDSRFRLIRAIKNRFGAVNELGLFAMTDSGLKDIKNPSAIFLTQSETALAGSVVMVTREGTRPILVEVQALVDEANQQSKRVSLGLDSSRLSMLLAVLNRHAGINTHHQDIFINVVGGVKITETAIDLALVLAVYSSLKDQPLIKGLVTFGEIGLAGEIRPVSNGQERLLEAKKHGFTHAIVPKSNTPKQDIGMKIYPIGQVQELIDLIRNQDLTT